MILVWTIAIILIVKDISIAAGQQQTDGDLLTKNSSGEELRPQVINSTF